MTKANVIGSKLRISERDELVSGSGNANRLSLRFSPDWSGLVKQIDFKNRASGVARRISADDGECTVPWEVLESCGEVDCCLRGLDSEGKLVKRTNEENLGTVLSEYDGEAAETAAATPELLDALAASVGALAQRVENGEHQIFVSFTADNAGNITADKSYEEILAEVNAGKLAIRDDDGRYYLLVSSRNGRLQFVCVDEQPYIYDLSVSSDNRWRFAMEMLVTENSLRSGVENKLDKYLGTEHAGEVLVVGSNGVITTRAM